MGLGRASGEGRWEKGAQLTLPFLWRPELGQGMLPSASFSQQAFGVGHVS